MATRKTAASLESVGWLFFLVVFVLLLAPAYWLGTNVVREESPLLGKLGLAAVLAAVTAALTAVVVNGVLQRINKRRKPARKKGKR